MLNYWITEENENLYFALSRCNAEWREPTRWLERAELFVSWWSKHVYESVRG
jgi:hypothetical protein